LLVLPAQPTQFVTLGAGQVVIANAFIAFGLFNPAVDRGNTRLKLASQTFNTATGPRQRNKLVPEFRRVRVPCSRHEKHSPS
jgi:hypothetical protein